MENPRVPGAAPGGPREHGARAGGGVIEHFSGLLAAFLAYLQARLLLAGIESKEAAIHYAMLLVWTGGALVLCFLGYIFVCIGLVFAVAYFFQDPSKWIWVMLGFGAVHFAVAIFCVLIARSKIFAPMFRETISELKKDQLWLNRLSEKPN